MAPYPDGCDASDCGLDEIAFYFMAVTLLGSWFTGTFSGFAYKVLSRARRAEHLIASERLSQRTLGLILGFTAHS